LRGKSTMAALLSLEEAADFFGCHPDTVRLRAAAGIIRGAKVGRARRFKQADLGQPFRRVVRRGMSIYEREGIWHSPFCGRNSGPKGAFVPEKLGGWETREMVERYAHLSPSRVARFADNARVPGTRNAAWWTPIAATAF
jgi:excisionase family DNA binding protein